MGNIERGIKRLDGEIREIERDLKQAEGTLDRCEPGSWEYDHAKQCVTNLKHRLNKAQSKLEALYAEYEDSEW